MNKQITKMKFLVLAIFTLCSLATEYKAQTTVFTYQGRLNDTSVASPTNGTYEMQFKLFNAVQNGAQSGATQVIPTVQVVNGIFTVQLDSESSFNSGADIYVEISVRPAGSQAAVTTLAPRQQVTSVPYSIKSKIAQTSVNADNLGNLPASSYTQNTDSRLSDDRNPTAGSTNYVQNQTSTPQSSTNFNISGSGKADTFDATTQFNIGGNRVFSVKGSLNVFAGANAGTSNTGGNSNTFVGNFAGNANTNGKNNSFFGTDAGRNNTADYNSFFGRSAGYDNTTGAYNAFFGVDAGRYNQAGNTNAFFGQLSGNKSNADNNSFFGFQSGAFTTTGGGNSFFGNNAGFTNTTGANNTIIGNGANVGANNLNFATAIGAGAVVSTSNTVVLGTSATSTEIPGTLKVFTLGETGITTLCRNASNQIADCTTVNPTNFINNSTVQQSNSDFNISGNGTLGGTLSANVVSSATNFKVGLTPVFSTPNLTSVVAGQQENQISTGPGSTFFGYFAGRVTNASGQLNTFIGSTAGYKNIDGDENTFVGQGAGSNNVSGNYNSFFGSVAGVNNVANGNSFFGYSAGTANSTGAKNSFFGYRAGVKSQTVDDNTFFGYQAGDDATGGQNTIFGSQAGSTTTTGVNNSLFGYNARATGNGNEVFGASGNVTGNGNTLIGGSSVDGNFNTIIGPGATTQGISVTNSTAIGMNAVVTTNNTIVLGTNAERTSVPGTLSITGKTSIISLGAAGSTSLCRNGFNEISTCTAGNFANPDSAAMMKEISDQKARIETQRATIDALKKLVCATNSTADVCQEVK